MNMNIQVKSIAATLMICTLLVLGNSRIIAQSEINTALSIAWRSNGDLIAVAGNNQTVTIWDPNTSQIYQILQGHNAEVSAVSWNNQGNRLAGVDTAGNLLIWDTNAWQLLIDVSHSESNTAFLSLAWNPDGTQLAVSDSRGAISIFDTVTGELIHRLLGHYQLVLAVAWSPDGQYIVSGGWDSQIVLWDATTYQIMGRFKDETGSAIHTIDWRADSLLIALGNSSGDIQIWDPFTEILVEQFEAHPDNIFGTLDVVWSSNNTFLVSSGGDQVIRMWNTTNFQMEDSISLESIAYGIDVNPVTGDIAYFYEGIHIFVPQSGAIFAQADPDQTVTDTDSR